MTLNIDTAYFIVFFSFSITRMNQNSTHSQHRCITALNSYYSYAYTTYVHRFYTMQVLQCIHLLYVDVLSGNQSCHYLNSFVNKSF